MAIGVFLTRMGTQEIDVLVQAAVYDEDGSLIKPAVWEKQTVPSGRPHVPLNDGEDLTYINGEAEVNRDFLVDTPLENEEIIKVIPVVDEEDNQIGTKYVVRKTVIVPATCGGFVCMSEAPPAAPPDTVLVTLIGTNDEQIIIETEAVMPHKVVSLNEINNRLFAEDARFGLYTEINNEADGIGG